MGLGPGPSCISHPSFRNGTFLPLGVARRYIPWSRPRLGDCAGTVAECCQRVLFRSTQLPAALRKTLAAYPWMEPGCLLADRGYDSLANHQFLVGLGIIPVIHIRKPTAQDGLYDGIYTAEGKPTCPGQQPMEYVRTDPETGAHLFRCQAGGCRLKTEGTKAVIHCDGETWEGQDANLRVLEPLPRFTEAWKRLYRLSMSIERIFRSLKHSQALQGHYVRALRKITLHATLSALTFQATAARLRAKDPDRMRRMGVTVS